MCPPTTARQLARSPGCRSAGGTPRHFSPGARLLLRPWHDHAPDRGLALDAAVETASGGLGSTSTVAVDGALGSTRYTIYAAIDGPLTTAKIRRTVAGTSIRIDAAWTREQTRLTGSYEGPPALLALVAGALLHFMPPP
jgi:hypothetical protein